jgi:hypothetical protein
VVTQVQGEEGEEGEAHILMRRRSIGGGSGGAVKVETATGEATSDWSVLARIAKKDEEAHSALYDRSSGVVFSEAKRDSATYRRS